MINLGEIIDLRVISRGEKSNVPQNVFSEPRLELSSIKDEYLNLRRNGYDLETIKDHLQARFARALLETASKFDRYFGSRNRYSSRLDELGGELTERTINVAVEVISVVEREAAKQELVKFRFLYNIIDDQICLYCPPCAEKALNKSSDTFINAWAELPVQGLLRCKSCGQHLGK